MNPELYERYLAKKAKKLGISVEELKAQGTTPLVSSTTSAVETSSVASTDAILQEQNISSEKPTTLNNYSSSAQTVTSNYMQSNIASLNAQQPQYIQRTIQEQIDAQNYVVQETSYVQPQESDRYAPYSNMQPETVKTDVPSFIFGPSRIEEEKKEPVQSYNNSLNVNTSAVTSEEIQDTRENRFALIGYPLGHSLSAVIHSAGFKSLGIDATYEILETPPDDLVYRLKFLKRHNYKGFNVTIPLKLPISLFVNEVDKYADLARAVNTVSIEKDRTLKAYNTDVIGFRRAIPKDVIIRGKKVAVLGTGGAAHAACVALVECGVDEIAFFTRNIPNSIDLMNYVRRKFPSVTFNVYQIENIRNLSEYAMLVNTTPIGMLGKAGDMMPVERYALETLDKNAVVYDVIYNPKKTVLIKEAEKLGLRFITGLDMFIYQAVAAQEIWFGKTPDFKDMKIAALENL